MKRCAKCAELKPLEDFGKNARARDGRSYYCLPCYRAMHSEYRRQKAEREGRKLKQPRPRRSGEKWCPSCQEHKPVADFGSSRASRDGLTGYCRRCHNARAAETRQRLYGGGRHYHLVRRYGLSAADVDALVAAQGRRCPICEREIDDRAHVDHDHATGKVRAVLCFNCNGGLGQFGDSPSRLRRAARYLEQHAGPRVVERALRDLLDRTPRDGVTVHPPRDGWVVEYVDPHGSRGARAGRQ